MMNRVPPVVLLVILLSFAPSCLAQGNVAVPGPPPAVFCQQDTYALCAYANCTINADLTTASCPCLGIEGVSAARIDMIPDADIQQATQQVCNTTTSCQAPDGIDEAPLCEAIADQTLWPGADVVSTFSRALEVENGANVLDDGSPGDPTWTCAGVPGRFVPNCMLAPCRVLEPGETNDYYDGTATFECTCPLIAADIDYTVSGGKQSPCEDSPVPMEGGYAQNTGGALLMQFVQDQAAIDAAWAAVQTAFEASGTDGENDSLTAAPSDGGDGTSSTDPPSGGGDNPPPTDPPSAGLSFAKISRAYTLIIVMMLAALEQFW